MLNSLLIPICFSIKSNSNINLIREIKKFGLGADVVSIGELMLAIKAGVNPKKIVFSGVGKTSEEINYAISKKILLINAESSSEIKEIDRIARLRKKKVDKYDEINFLKNLYKIGYSKVLNKNRNK